MEDCVTSADISQGARVARQFNDLTEAGRRDFAREMERGRLTPPMSSPVGAQCDYREEGKLASGFYSQELSLSNIDEAMAYKPWNPDQIEVGNEVREALTAAARVILRRVSRSPLRTRALNCIIDCRMRVNAAITFGGKF